VFDPGTIEPDLRDMTRIVLRPIGSPLPLGFFTVAIDNVLVSALQWGLLPGGRADRLPRVRGPGHRRGIRARRP
jgi:hypothetical protein